MAWFLSKQDRAAITAADEFIKIITGHDSSANLKARYGAKWWDEARRIQRELTAITKSK